MIRPGQLGPMTRVPFDFAYAWKATESCTGMPSVMTTARPMPASAASTTADLAKAGGTNTTVTSAPVAAMPAATDPKTGTARSSKSTVRPALRGLTPPTTSVPAASMRRVCFMPSPPVMPWTRTLLSLVR